MDFCQSLSFEDESLDVVHVRFVLIARKAGTPLSFVHQREYYSVPLLFYMV